MSTYRLSEGPEIESGKLSCALDGGENDQSASRSRKVQRSAPGYSSTASIALERSMPAVLEASKSSVVIVTRRWARQSIRGGIIDIWSQ